MADIVVDYLDDEDDVDTLLSGLKVQLKPVVVTLPVLN